MKTPIRWKTRASPALPMARPVLPRYGKVLSGSFVQYADPQVYADRLDALWQGTAVPHYHLAPRPSRRSRCGKSRAGPALVALRCGLVPA